MKLTTELPLIVCHKELWKDERNIKRTSVTVKQQLLSLKDILKYCNVYNLIVPVLDLHSYIVWWKVAVAQVTLDSDLHDRNRSGLRTWFHECCVLMASLINYMGSTQSNYKIISILLQIKSV
jgi:hypothetical protein